MLTNVSLDCKKIPFFSIKVYFSFNRIGYLSCTSKTVGRGGALMCLELSCNQDQGNLIEA